MAISVMLPPIISFKIGKTVIKRGIVKIPISQYRANSKLFDGIKKHHKHVDLIFVDKSDKVIFQGGASIICNDRLCFSAKTKKYIQKAYNSLYTVDASGDIIMKYGVGATLEIYFTDIDLVWVVKEK